MADEKRFLSRGGIQARGKTVEMTRIYSTQPHPVQGRRSQFHCYTVSPLNVSSPMLSITKGKLIAVSLFKFLLRKLRGGIEVGFGENGTVNVLGVLDAVCVVKSALGNLFGLAKLFDEIFQIKGRHGGHAGHRGCKVVDWRINLFNALRSCEGGVKIEGGGGFEVVGRRINARKGERDEEESEEDAEELHL